MVVVVDELDPPVAVGLPDFGSVIVSLPSIFQ